MAQTRKLSRHGVVQCISPIDGSIYAERPLHTAAEVDSALARAVVAQKGWALIPLSTRQEIVLAALDILIAQAGEIGAEIAWQMGRPKHQAQGEILRGVQERVRYMTALAPRALADIVPPEQEGFTRYVRRMPAGVVAVVAPWNYPYLTSVNAIVPALLAGNAVVLKHSHQTPLCADRYEDAFRGAGLPENVFQFLDLSHADTERLAADARVGAVAFTGSVAGGRAVQKAMGGRFVSAGFELGGKDPAYVRSDADLASAVENLVDGAFFNSGQSCCGVERIYVHEKLYADFIDSFADLTRKYVLGNPLEADVTLGPMVRTAAADAVRAQVREAVRAGARSLVREDLFPASEPGTPYLAPQVLVNVDHTMSVMTEESFGPVVGIMKVGSDAEALGLMNDSRYGLTASVWTQDEAAAESLGNEIEAGTVFMNRCDYLDPALAWTGVKDSGCGVTLSSLGFDTFTRPKSFHLRSKA